MLFELFLVAVVCLILWFLNDRVINGKDMPPGPLRIPFFGNIIHLALRKKEPPYLMFQSLCKEYGSIMTLQIGFMRQVIVDDPETIKHVLCHEHWSDRPENEFVQQRSWGRSLGVLWGNGEPWKELRRFSIRTLRDFGFGKQKGQEIIMEEELTELLTNLTETIKRDGAESIEMNQFFTVSVLNIIWSMLAGIRFSHKDEALQALVRRLAEVMKLISASGNLLMAYPFLNNVLRKLTGYGQNRKDVIEKFHADFQSILDERRAQGFYKTDQRDFIDVFALEIDKHKGSGTEVYTEQQFIITAIDFFVAGSETTSNTLEFAFAYMILNPDVQKKVQQEIDQVVGFSRFPTASDKANMPYTEAVLHEVQRMANVAPMIARAPIQDVELKSYKLKKGTFVTLNTTSVHQSVEIWGNPHQFQPERFLDADRKIINTEKLLVFGTGKRVCPGEVLARATLFTYFTTMLQHYTFEASPSHPKPTVENPRFGITMAPQPYYAALRPRTF